MTIPAFDPWAVLARVREELPPRVAPAPVSRISRISREAPPEAETLPDGWETLPPGLARAAAFAIARRQAGACFLCAGRDWWRHAPGTRAICRVCHPPPGVV